MKRLAIVSIDGLRPEFYQCSAYPTPTLRALARRGASASGVEPIYPSVTFPCHSTIATGVRPSRHGIVSNSIFRFEECESPHWCFDSKLLKVPTLWGEAKSQKQARIALLRWPVTVGADVDWLVPEYFSVENADERTGWAANFRGVHPPELLAELLGVSRDREISDRARHDRFVTDSLIHLWRQYQPDLVLAHLINLDHLHHEFPRESRPVHQALAETDRLIAQILEVIDLDHDHLVILGDHGFDDHDKVVQANAIFAAKGWSPERVMAHVDGGQTSIYVRDSSLSGSVIQELQARAGTTYRLVLREELDRLGAVPDALCTLEPAPGFGSGCGNDSFIRQLHHPRAQHGYLPSRPAMRTGFIVAGPGIPAEASLGSLHLTDVGMTVAALFGVKMTEAEGKNALQPLLH